MRFIKPLCGGRYRRQTWLSFNDRSVAICMFQEALSVIFGRETVVSRLASNTAPDPNGLGATVNSQPCSCWKQIRHRVICWSKCDPKGAKNCNGI
jgi:hypothetical protein